MTKWDVDGRPFPWANMVAKENEFDDILFAFGLFQFGDRKKIVDKSHFGPHFWLKEGIGTVFFV